MQARVQRPGAGQQVLLVILLVASLASLHTVFRATMGDLLQLKSRALITQWQANPLLVPSVVDLGKARNDLVAAQAWLPGDPQVQEHLGYIYGVRASRAHALPELSGSFLDQAIVYYRAAIERRPMSSYAWANLTLALYLKGEQGTLLWQAFERACQYGRRERGVQLIVAEVGFSLWGKADERQRQMLVDLVDTALEPTRTQLFAIAGRHGQAARFAGR